MFLGTCFFVVVENDEMESVQINLQSVYAILEILSRNIKRALYCCSFYVLFLNIGNPKEQVYGPGVFLRNYFM